MSEDVSYPPDHAWNAKLWDWPLEPNDGLIRVLNTTNKFEVDFQLPEFAANEVDVNLKGQELALHCQRVGGGGRIAREIHRTYHVPADVDPRTLKQNWSTDGTLHVSAEKLEKHYPLFSH